MNALSQGNIMNALREMEARQFEYVKKKNLKYIYHYFC